MLNILFDFKKNDFILQESDFLLVLGFNSIGKKVLNKVKKEVKIYTKLPINTSNTILLLQNKVDSIYNYNYKIDTNTNLILK